VVTQLRARRIPIDRDADLCALAARCRDAGADVVLFDDPSDGATAALGIGRLFDIVGDAEGARIESAAGEVLGRDGGPGRLAATARLWHRLAETVEAEERDAVVAVGGFAFRPDRDPRHPWAGFPSALLRLPEVVVLRRDRAATAYGIVSGAPGSDRGCERWLGLLARAAVPFRAPAAGRLTTTPVRPAHQWMASVDGAIAALRSGRGAKVVLARELVVRADGPLHAGAVARELKRRQPSCFVYLVAGSDGSALVGASPELLVRREGRRAVSQPMAGTAPRGRTAHEDGELARALQASPKQAAEHSLVVTDVRDRYVAAGADPVHVAPRQLLRFANVQHLATGITAHFRGSAPSVLALCARLHPTAAVGAVPWPEAAPLIDEHEQMERGWYAGAVGWTNALGDGAFTLALRCGLLWEDGVRLYAGAGVMPDSTSLEELQETDVKFLALLDALRESLRRPQPTASGAC
jgi:isochorismate synthase